MKLQDTILRIWTDLEHVSVEALLNVATSKAELHNGVMKARCSLSESIDEVASFDEDIAMVAPGQTGKAELEQTSEGGTDQSGITVL